MSIEDQIPVGFKPSSLGLIPNDWHLIKIKDIGKISSGTTPLRSERKYHEHGTLAWVKTTDLNNSKITFTEEKITQTALDETSLRIYPIDTILVAMYGGFNQIGRTGILGIAATINQAISAISVNEHIVNPLFLLYWFNGKVGLWKNFAGSSRKDPNITSKDVGDFPFIQMDYSEQTAIANCLSVWDNAIRQTQGLIQQKELRKNWLMQQLLTGKRRLPGFIGAIEFHVLRPYIKEVSERNRDNDVINVLSVTKSRGFINQSEQFDRIVASEDISNYKIVRKGQFAYNPSRINVGSLDLLRDFELGILSPMYVVFETNPEILNNTFLYYHLKSFRFTSHIPMFVQGSVRDSLGFDGLCNMKFFIPTLEEQKAIAELLQLADIEIELLKKRAEKLKKQKMGLMQILFTGKKRLFSK